MQRGNLFWGGVILLIGVLLLLNSLGLLPGSVWLYFWPLLLILLGVWFLLGPLLGRGDWEKRQLSVPLEGARSAEVELHHGAGRIQLGALAAEGLLMEGTFEGGVEDSLQRGAEQARLTLRAPVGVMLPFFGRQPGFIWSLNLARHLPLKLRIETGASETLADLTDLLVEELILKTGASSTQVMLPAQAGFSRVQVEAGAASVVLRVPEGVAARIRVESGLAGINVDTDRFPRRDSGYETPGYDGAAQRTEIDIRAGVGSIEIR